MTNWNRVLAFYGVSTSKGVVLDNDPGSYYRSETYLLPQVAESEETDSVLSGNGYVFMAYSKALMAGETENVTITNLLTTSDNAYLHSDVTAKTEDFGKKDTDETGQYVVGLKASINTGGTSSSQDEVSVDETSVDAASADADTSVGYLFGSVLALSDGADQMVSGSNALLFSAVVSSCTKEEGGQAAIDVPVKSVSSAALTVPTQTAIVVNVICIFAIPATLLLTGFVLWLIRRRK